MRGGAGAEETTLGTHFSVHDNKNPSHYYLYLQALNLTAPFVIDENKNFFVIPWFQASQQYGNTVHGTREAQMKNFPFCIKVVRFFSQFQYLMS